MISWLVSPSYPDYEVSEVGGLRRCTIDKKGHIYPHNLKPRIVRGYQMYGISVNGKDRKVYAHQLVLEAFVGPKPFDTAQACHCDGDAKNNYYRNLRWDTPAGNQADRRMHGTAFIGEKNPTTKLTDSKVHTMRQMSSAGHSQRRIAREFMVSQSAVSNIVTRKNWSHV